MPEYWKIVCKDCGKTFEYSDHVLQIDMKSGMSRPERCKGCRDKHGSVIKLLGNSHFELTPIKGHSSILGTPFIGMLDHTDRTIEKLEVCDESKKMDLGLKDSEENNIREIYSQIDNHQVVIIVAATGTGKSTYLPYRLAFPIIDSSNNDPNKYLKYGPIVVTQPRKIATEGIAQAIAKNLCISMVGKDFEIGFKYSEKEDYSLKNRLIFVTDGSLLNWIARGRIGQFSMIIIDEAHERSKNIDLILSLIKNELPKYPNLKLIILSATIDSQKFYDFFQSTENLDSVKVLDYTDNKYAVKKFKYEEIGDWKYSELKPKTEIGYQQSEKDIADANKILKDYEQEIPQRVALKIIELINSTENNEGILAFLPGVAEINQCIEEIKRRQPVDRNIKLFELYSSQNKEDRDKAAKPFEEPDKIIINGTRVFPRRVVVATNIAETSVTFDDIVHVIDSGLIKQNNWDPIACVQYMRTQFHSKDGSKQRWGRTGRKCDGFVYKLYPKDWFIRFFPNHTSPEIERCCLDEVFLNSMESGVTDISKLSWLTEPNSIEFKRVHNVISERKLLDEDGDLTEIGREILKLRKTVGSIIKEFDNNTETISFDISVLIVRAEKYGCLIEAVTLASALPHLCASMHVLQDDKGEIESGRNGFFVWNYNWDLLSKDFVRRIQKELQFGCNDDLDFVFKLSIIIDLIKSKETQFYKEFEEKHFLNDTNVVRFLNCRDKLLQSFTKGKQYSINDLRNELKNNSEKDSQKDKGSIRSLNYDLIKRLRLISALALPDRVGKIVSHNNILVFENQKGMKFLLSPNLAGKWSEGDKAVALIYSQSPYIIDFNSDDPSKNSDSSPFVEFLIRISENRLLDLKDPNDLQVLQFIKKIPKETTEDEIKIKNMFLPFFASTGSSIFSKEIKSEVQLKDVILERFDPKVSEVQLENQVDDQLEKETSREDENDDYDGELEVDLKTKKIIEGITKINVNVEQNINHKKVKIENWEIIDKIACAELTSKEYYAKIVHPEIMEKDYVEASILRDIIDSKSRKRVGYMVAYRNQIFPVPVENMTIDPDIAFQKSLVGMTLYFRNLRTKSLPFNYGLTILPYLENELKNLVFSKSIEIKLIAIKKDKNFGKWSNFSVIKNGIFPLYLNVRYTGEHILDEISPSILSFSLSHKRVLQKMVANNLEIKNYVIEPALRKHNFIFEDGFLKCKDIRSIGQFIELFDVFYKSTGSFQVYRSIRQLYTNSYQIEILMEAFFDKVVKDINNFIDRLGYITDNERNTFKIEISEYQKEFNKLKNHLGPSFEILDKIISSIWKLDVVEVNYLRMSSDLEYFQSRLKKSIARNKTEIANKFNKLIEEKKQQIVPVKEEKSKLKDSVFQLRKKIIETFSLTESYGVKSVGPDEPFQTIQEALDAAFDGDLILIAEGCYNESIVIKKNIVLKGNNEQRNSVIISSSDKFTVIVNSERVCIENITLEQNGNIDENNEMHASVYNKSNSLLLHECNVISKAPIGIENAGSLFLYDTSVTANKDNGAGIYTEENSILSILKSNIQNCTCGIFSVNSTKIFISKCVLNTNFGVKLNGNKPPIFTETANTWNCKTKIGGSLKIIKEYPN